MWTNATVIVSAADQQKANELLGASVTDEEGNVTVTPSNHFTTGLSADGTEPATHYIASGAFNNDELNVLLNDKSVDFFVYFGDVQAAKDANGLTMVEYVPVQDN